MIGPARPQGDHRPDFCVIFPTGDGAELGAFDIAWEVLMRPGSFQPAACAEVPASEPVGDRRSRVGGAARGSAGRRDDDIGLGQEVTVSEATTSSSPS